LREGENVVSAAPPATAVPQQQPAAPTEARWEHTP